MTEGRDIQPPGVPRTLFIHGAPVAHALHAALARAVGATAVRVDRLLPYHSSGSRTRRYLSWLLNGLLLPNSYDLYLTEGPQIPPLVRRWLHLVGKRQRLAALMANETLFFLKMDRYDPPTRRFLLHALSAFDALVCMGSMQATLAEDVLAGLPRRPRILLCRTALDDARRLSMERVRPDLESRLLVFVGHGPAGWRGWYKGMDVLFETMGTLRERGIECRLRIVGSWDTSFITPLLESARLEPGWIELVGPRESPASAFEGACLYVHLGRGDAWPVSVLEAMTAGLPPLVSEWTGSKEAAERVEERLVVPFAAQEAASRIEWYFGQTPEARQRLSARAREVAAEYDMVRAGAAFRCAVREVMV